MERQDSRTLRAAGSQHGLARFVLDDQWTQVEDYGVSIDQDLPPTPPPKTTSAGLQLPQTRKFGTSLSSLFTRASGGSAQLGDGRYEDNDSFRGLSISSSSSHSREIRRQKSSTFLAKLRPQPSKQHIRSESEDADHPSLKPPVPPLPPQPFTFNPPTIASTVSVNKIKRSVVTKKSSSSKPPPPPPKEDPLASFVFSPSGIKDISLDEVEGFVDLNRGSAGISSEDIAARTGFSTSDLHPQFSNPFPTGPYSPDHYRWPVTRKPSNPLPPDSAALPSAQSGVLISSNWPVPPSWSVVGKPSAASPGDDLSDDSESDGAATCDEAFHGNYSRKTSNAFHGNYSRKTSNTPATSVSPGLDPSGALGSVTSQPEYKVKLYLPGGREHVVTIGIDTTVANLTTTVLRDFGNQKDSAHDQPPKDGFIELYLKEQMRERMLGPNEKPAAIVKLRMEQAGYTDSMHLIGPENLHILLRFVFKNQLLAGEANIDLDSYTDVDLSLCSLRTIPPIVHRNAEQIITLRLSRNPMLEIPLDFIQSCQELSTLQLTHMYMKQVPESVHHCTTLHTLDISSNAIRDLESTNLTGIPGLTVIEAQNNRLSSLPSHFGLLKALTVLNISNNKFRVFPPVLAEIPGLQILDISFNMIAELPAELGLMTSLVTFIIIGNQISNFPVEMSNLVNLQRLDVSRNNISDLSLACRLPNIEFLHADHNVVRALDLALGPNLTELVASHNDITQLTLAPGPLDMPPLHLTTLDVSHAKLSSIDNLPVAQLQALRHLKLNHNSICSLPQSIGDLTWLETLSCTNNKLDGLPVTIGKLQKLEILDAHNNNITELPQVIWNCASLTQINVTSNFLATWPDLPSPSPPGGLSTDGNPTSHSVVAQMLMKSSQRSQGLPSLAYSLEKLYIGENLLTDNAIISFMIFKELRVLNMSFNKIHDLPANFFRNMVHIEELYLSGNKLISIPVEDLHRLKRLTMLFLNGNKLQTLPQELGKVLSLRVLDVGSNNLRYNINNWEFDWNWNFNINLKYLNLSGNQRFQIKAPLSSHGTSKAQPTQVMSGFKSLTQLRLLGLMDVTVTTTAHDAIDIPDENADRRVRTSLSTVCEVGYGISDSLGTNNHLMYLDLVHEFQQKKYPEAIFAIFGRSQSSPPPNSAPHRSRGLHKGTSPNQLMKYVHDNFVSVFKQQEILVAAGMNVKQEMSPQQRKDIIPKALTRTFLKLNQDFCEKTLLSLRKNTHSRPHTNDGVTAVVVYLCDRTLYAANVGDAVAIVSRAGKFQEISRKHHPFDRAETGRIRAAEGYISPSGLVNDEVPVSRAFGYYNFFPPINARPDVITYDLADNDEFIIIASRGLWDYIPYQTAVDITRNSSPRTDPMLAAQMLRDFAIGYGADDSLMIMVVCVSDLFHKTIPDPILDHRQVKADVVRDRGTKYVENEIPAPLGHLTLVFTDIRNSTHLWEVNPGMTTAMRLHNTLLRRELRLCGGYEVKTEGDAFMCSFPTALSAVWWCLTVQIQLMHESWPVEILDSEDGKEIRDPQDNIIARGLSVRMGIHSGTPLCEPDLVTHRMDYFGPMVNRSARIESSAKGGQIACSEDIVNEITTHVLEPTAPAEDIKPAVDAIRSIGVNIIHVGEVKLKGIELPQNLSILYPAAVRGRHDLKQEQTSFGSRVLFSASQLEDLGILCLRIEALSTGRRFRPISERKASIASNGGEQEEKDAEEAKFLYCDPKLLLPAFSDRSSAVELMYVLDSLILRITNAINTLAEMVLAPKPPSRTPQHSIMSTLKEDGKLDADTLQYIAGLLSATVRPLGTTPT